MSDFIDRADDALAGTVEAPRSLDDYVDLVLENPRYASQSSKYLLEAIEHFGTRTVIEEGEEKERYCFFDDPCGNGEHAVLGNTDILNQFVDDLRRMASDEGDNERIVWFGGPTATGKSELKRCLVNGLRGYSKTEAGKRFTMEWNIATASESDDRGLSYSDTPVGAESEWYQSPVNGHPLSVFPTEVREDILAAMNEDEEYPVTIDADLDPFCKEAYDFLETHYSNEGVENLFSHITDPRHLRITRQTVDVGEGIGILHAEDDGSPKERLVGGWMPSMLQELGSRGRKNPQAFSYDGVLSQGNGLLTLVEDASQHADLLQKLLNIPEENLVKLDKKIGMDIDTVLVVLSNPDLEAQLTQHADKLGADPLKALRRRLDKHQFRYLTNLSSEVELIHRELAGEREVWTETELDEEARDERVREPLDVYGCEFAPHAIEAAALYEVVTRLTDDDLGDGLDLVDKALLFDRGYHEEDNERTDISEFDLPEENRDGEVGIPVTYTKDVLADLAQSESLLLPHNVLTALADHLADDPVFSQQEVAEYTNRVTVVGKHIHLRQEEDVIAAMLRDRRVDEDAVQEYVDAVYAWDEAESEDTDAEDADYDPLKLKVFETDHLGLDEDDYDGSDPDDAVVEFRREKIISPLNKHMWDSRDGFEVDDPSLKDAPVLKSLLGTHDWDAVFSAYENFDPAQWRDPPSGTQTESLKETTIENLQEMFGYSQTSATQVSTRVMDALRDGPRDDAEKRATSSLSDSGA